MNHQKVNIGFDAGISSAGWSVVSAETGEIIESGVRLFSGADAARNEERRTNRQSRRLLRRRRTRLIEAKHLIEKELNITVQKNEANPYELRVKGLTTALTKQQLATVLLHIIKRRGVSYDLGDLSNDDDIQGFETGINYNRQLLKNKTPGEIQYERFLQYGKVRGRVENEQGQLLLNIFPTEDYVKEATRILNQQKEYITEIDDEFISKYTVLLQRKRDYFVGPGNEKSRTDYGIYRTDGETLDNLFEILIGKDKFYPEELRAAGSSYTAQLFNLLNDLNNLRITGTENQKISSDQKEEIIQMLKTTNRLSGGMIGLISKVTKTPKDQISGYRKDQKDKPEIHSLAIYRKIRNKLLTYDIDINEWPTSLLDDLAPIMTLNTEKSEIRRQIEKVIMPKYSLVDDKIKEILVDECTLFVGTSNNKWHRFSLKTMQELLPELLETSKEQHTLLVEHGFLFKNKETPSMLSQININEILEGIYNPVVRKSVRELLKVFNALIKKYDCIDTVVIEMPREDNEADARRQAEKRQKENKKRKDAATKAFIEECNIDEAQYSQAIRRHRRLPQEINLWYEQEGKCPYSGETIEAYTLYSNHDLFDIDHIIPQSISYDDRMSNKVLCFKAMNDHKAQQTPYMFMKDASAGHQSYSEMKAMIMSNKRMSPTKKDNLLCTDDINDMEVRKRFINRNLVDTRYASRMILNAIQNFARHSQYEGMKVTVIRGQFTDAMRRRIQLDKTRETYHHHAVDASIIAMAPKLKLWASSDKSSLIPTEQSNEEVVDVNTGEIFSDEEYRHKFKFNQRFIHDVQQLISQNKIKFSHQVDKKMNRKVSDATIYSTRDAQLSKDKKAETYVISKIKNIYDTKEYERFKKIYDKNKEQIIMYHKDPKTWDKLEKIIAEYPDKEENSSGKLISVSPFELYRRENGPVTKYAKKNNGPAITQLKYYDKKLGNNIDITPEDAKNKKVVLQSLKPWRTDVYYNHGKGEYEIMGIKYSDLQYSHGQYGILATRYNEIKVREKISSDAEFLFSLYKNDTLKVVNSEDETIELRHLSRTMPNKRGYVELKPIDKFKFDSKEHINCYGAVANNGQCLKKLAPKGFKLYKVNTDILGNCHYLQKESAEPKNILYK